MVVLSCIIYKQIFRVKLGPIWEAIRHFYDPLWPPGTTRGCFGMFWGYPSYPTPIYSFWGSLDPLGTQKCWKMTIFDPKIGQKLVKSEYFGGIWPPYHPQERISTIWGHIHPFIAILGHFCLIKGYFWWFIAKFDIVSSLNYRFRLILTNFQLVLSKFMNQ